MSLFEFFCKAIIQFDQHHLMKVLSLFQCVFLNLILSEIRCLQVCGLKSGSSLQFPLTDVSVSMRISCCFSYYITVVHLLKLGDDVTSSSFFLLFRIVLATPRNTSIIQILDA